MSSGLDIQEFLAGYLAEAQELVANASQAIVAIDESLRSGENNPGAVRALFRALHTIKGLSGMVGAEPIVELSHAMETVLREADSHGGRLRSEALDVIARGLRAIEQRVHELGAGQQLSAAPRSLLDELGTVPVASQPPVPSGALSLDPALAARLSAAEQEQLLIGVRKGRRAARVEFLPSPAKASQGHNINSVRERVGILGELVKVIPLALPVSEEAPGGLGFVLLVLTDASDEQLAHAAATSLDKVSTIAESSAPAAPDPSSDTWSEVPERQKYNFVRVDVSRLDEALDHLSEFVVSRFRLEHELQALQGGKSDTRELAAIIQEAGRNLRDLRASIMRARMVPVTELLERTPLVVRGLAKASGKSVRLELQASRAELDKAVSDRIFPAIVHLLRNAVDHAIETPAERESAGKPQEAVIRIRCDQQGSSRLELSVSDDGRGVDIERLAEVAGVPVPRTERELLSLLARPGLTTREAVTTTSGRGMGMEIVRRTIVDELGGDILLRSAPGRGTTFTLVVPMSVTIVDAFSFACGNRMFVAPVSSVWDLAELEQSAVSEGPRGSDQSGPVRVLRHRGELVPLLQLDALLQLPASGLERRKAIIVRRTVQDAPLAFEVDQMVGHHEVVVRPLLDPLVRVPGVMGSTDLGDGNPTLVLDLAGLARGASPTSEAIGG